MSKIIFGIDVGGTTCKCGTFSEEGELLRKEEIGRASCRERV